MESGGIRGRGGRTHACQERLRGGGPKSAAQLPAAVPSFLPPPAQLGASGAVQDGGIQNPAAQLPAAVLSAKRTPTSPSRTCGKGALSKQSRTSAPRPPSIGPSSLHPTAPVELPPKVVDLCRRAGGPEEYGDFLVGSTTRPTNSPSPTRWELDRSRIKGRFNNYITPTLENIADLPCEPASRRWQDLPEDNGQINIGLVEQDTRSSLVLIHQQVIIDSVSIMKQPQPAEVIPRRRLSEVVAKFG